MRASVAVPLLVLVLPLPGCLPRPSSPVGPVSVVDVEETAVCVVDPASPTGLALLHAIRERESGETLVEHEGRYLPLAEVQAHGEARGYARSQEWFINGVPIRWVGEDYLKFGEERTIPVSQLRRGGEYGGVVVFVGSRAALDDPLVYVPTEAGCVFQPYMRATRVRGIRGE